MTTPVATTYNMCTVCRAEMESDRLKSINGSYYCSVCAEEKEGRESKVARADFLSNLKAGDKVLVCFEDGEIYDATEVSPQSNDTRILVYRNSMLSGQPRFYRKTGKQHGGGLYLRPYDEARYQAHVDEMEAIRQEVKQRKEVQDAENRDSLTNDILCILGTADMIDGARLSRLSTSDLQTLATLLKKLDEA